MLMSYFRVSRFLLFWICLSVPSLGAENSSPLRFTWQKNIQRGTVETYGLELNEKGVGKFHFKKREEDLIELGFMLKQSTVESLLSMFTQADFLNESINFVSSRKVADMGMKTICFENGSRKREVTFNYTENRNLQEIVNFFENLCQQEKSLSAIDLALKYDRLGIPKKLDELERNLAAKRIVAPERFAPVLERIYRDESLMNLARTEAKKILSQIEKMQSVAN
jgi:hypothetical protein